TEAGTRPTRNSSVLISLGTPTRIASSCGCCWAAGWARRPAGSTARRGVGNPRRRANQQDRRETRNRCARGGRESTDPRRQKREPVLADPEQADEQRKHRILAGGVGPRREARGD